MFKLGVQELCVVVLDVAAGPAGSLAPLGCLLCEPVTQVCKRDWFLGTRGIYDGGDIEVGKG